MPSTPGLFCTLPQELVEKITFLSEPADIRALRQTCRTLHWRTDSLFWRTSLQTVYTDLSRASLQRLEMIAQHPQQHYVRCLTLKEHQLGEGFQWTRHGDGHLLPEQPATKQLCNIIHQLDNCKSFEIYAVSESDDPDLSDDVRGTDDVRDTDAAPVILDAIAASCFLVTSFTANFRIGDQLNHPDPRRLGKAPVDRAGFIAAWSHLKELTLSLDLECYSNEEWALDLILHAPNLEKLNLEVGGEDNWFNQLSGISKQLMAPVTRISI